ncbi:MAG: HEAT repeat domain-containing protein [Planctomycetota bacterium]
MGSSRSLWAVLAVLFLAVLFVYGYRWLFPPVPRAKSADELAAAALGDGTVKDRQYAAVKLSELGKPARRQLLHVLDQSQQAEVRVACIQSLTEQWDYRSMPRLFDLMDDPSPAVRQQADEAVQCLIRDCVIGKVPGDYQRAERQRLLSAGYSTPLPMPSKVHGDQRAERQAVIKNARSEWERFKQSGLGRTFIREKLGGEDL